MIEIPEGFCAPSWTDRPAPIAEPAAALSRVLGRAGVGVPHGIRLRDGGALAVLRADRGHRIEPGSCVRAELRCEDAKDLPLVG